MSSIEVARAKFEEQIGNCAYKGEDVVSAAERQVRAVEVRHCQESFLRFFKWARINETSTISNLGGVIPMEMWPHLKYTINFLLTKNLLSVWKSRQEGLSYIVALYVLWNVISKPGSVWLLFSRGKASSITWPKSAWMVG